MPEEGRNVQGRLISNLGYDGQCQHYKSNLDRTPPGPFPLEISPRILSPIFYRGMILKAFKIQRIF
jgi:hypothetical protein